MSRSLRRRLFLIALLAGAPPLVVACFVGVSTGTKVRERDTAGTTSVLAPVRAHLTDGSTAIYRDGIVVRDNVVTSRSRNARRLGVRGETIALTSIPLDSIVGMESFHANINPVGSVLLSVLGTTVTAIGVAAGAVIVFGSCPTIYADSAGTPVLQAEVFATRISSLLEARDIDLLSARPDSQGTLRLEVRNEALETHYINHFELLEVRHARDRKLIPDEHGRPLLTGAWTPPAAARDRAGRDVASTMGRRDDAAFESDSGVLARASAEDPFDWVDLTFPRPAGDSAVIGLHLRNSLLNTVLLYDLMLARPGARAIDWLASDMRRIGPALQFGRWYREHFGLRVFVYDGGKWKEIERHPTYGPVAWREAATVVPVLQEDSLRVRLRFAADEWRIDWAAMAGDYTRPRTRAIRIAAIEGVADTTARTTREQLRSADERYLQTFPGQRFWVRFDAGPEPVGEEARSFLLASQGWYSEWIRGEWVRQATDTAAFRPGAASLNEAFRRWGSKRDSVTKAFFATRVPVGAP